jgi:hypothetical protein
MGWNCHGLGPPATVQELERLVHTHKPKVLFLLELGKIKITWKGLDGDLA